MLWAEDVELAGVISQPDRPAGRGRHLHKNAVSAWAVAEGVPLLQPEKPGSDGADWLRLQQVDLALVMAYGHILRQNVLEAAPQWMWNLHASVLPAYRGASPIESAIADGARETGVSLIRMVTKMDAGGPVVGVEKVAILSTDTGLTLRGRLAQACVPLLQRHLREMGSPSVRTIDQNEAQASYTRKLTKQDSHLDFTASAADLERRIRALSSTWPGVIIEHGGQAIKIGTAAVMDDERSPGPGTILRAGPAGVDIATGLGTLRLLTLQRPGGRMMEAGEFLRGYRLAAGEILPEPTDGSPDFPRPHPREHSTLGLHFFDRRRESAIMRLTHPY